MRITFILPSVNMSGGIKVIATYASALVEMGHDVCLVSCATLANSGHSENGILA